MKIGSGWPSWEIQIGRLAKLPLGKQTSDWHRHSPTAFILFSDQMASCWDLIFKILVCFESTKQFLPLFINKPTISSTEKHHVKIASFYFSHLIFYIFGTPQPICLTPLSFQPFVCIYSHVYLYFLSSFWRGVWNWVVLGAGQVSGWLGFNLSLATLANSKLNIQILYFFCRKDVDCSVN